VNGVCQKMDFSFDFAFKGLFLEASMDFFLLHCGLFVFLHSLTDIT